ncbi:MAG: hypothetical protein PUC14_03610 [Bacteroidales bacterium]|nr:hypothetical protein [Bacteroidales bacterium]MDD5974806.1 hypothetical protein [Bacteroidales bacterium]
MKTLKSKLFFMTTLMMVITVFAGCPHKPINPPEPPENDSTEIIKQQLNFSVVWKNNLGSSLEISASWNEVVGTLFNSLDTVLQDGDSIVVAVVNKMVEVDSIHTIQMYEEEMLMNIIESVKSVNLRYFEDNLMYTSRDGGLLQFGEYEDYMSNNSVKTLVVSKDFLSSSDLVTVEGELKTISLNWKNTFAKSIGLKISSFSNPELNITKQIAPDETIKVTELSYYVFPNNDELNAKLLADVMSDYKSSLDDVMFLLPDVKSHDEWISGGEWTGDSIRKHCLNESNNYLFDIKNYEYNVDYTLILYNRLLYFLLGEHPDNEIEYNSSVIWKNDMSVPMVVDIRYRNDRIYSLVDKINCTIQPGESFQMPDFYYVEYDGQIEIQPSADSWYGLYINEMESVVITYGDKTYNMAVDGRCKFVCPNYTYGYGNHTFIEQSFKDMCNSNDSDN